MESSSRIQAIWLARGAAVAVFLRRLLRALHTGAGQLRDVGLAGLRLPKRP